MPKKNGSLDRIVISTNDAVIASYEQCIATIQRERRRLDAEAAVKPSPQDTFDEMFKPALELLTGPENHGR